MRKEGREEGGEPAMLTHPQGEGKRPVNGRDRYCMGSYEEGGPAYI